MSQTNNKGITVEKLYEIEKEATRYLKGLSSIKKGDPYTKQEMLLLKQSFRDKAIRNLEAAGGNLLRQAEIRWPVPQRHGRFKVKYLAACVTHIIRGMQVV